jgi:NifB/MoaA-like Fe-S oxidoreductase
LQSEITPQVTELGIDLTFKAVRNDFWGGTVTIAGLLSGSDLLQAALRQSDKDDIILLPPNCLNNDDLFIDNLTLAEFRKKSGRTVVVGSYDFVETLKEALEIVRTPELSNSNIRPRALHANRSVAFSESALTQ